MKKKDLTKAVKKAKAEQKEVLETMYNAMSKTAKAKMDKDENVKKAFDRHGMQH